MLVDKGYRQYNYYSLIWKELFNLPKDSLLINLGDVCIGNDLEIHNKLALKNNIKKILVKGNHDSKCLSKRTRLLTRNGYKYYSELSIGDIIPTFNLVTNKVEFNPINEIFIYKNIDKLYVADSASGRIEVTNHHVVLNQLGTLALSTIWKKQLAENLWNSKTCFRIPVMGSSSGNINIDKHMLELMAWIMTDGSIEANHKLVIYQSKIKFINEIKELLCVLKVPYTESIRNRKITEILGRKIKQCLPQHTFKLDINFSQKFCLEFNYYNKYKIPDLLWDLSDQDFDIFLNTLIKGDGHIQNSGTLVLWGKKELLMDILGLCVTHNKHANLCKQTGKENYYLSIRKNKSQKQYNPKQLSIEYYNDTVWCVNVKNNTLFVELGGKPYITGNSNLWYLNHGWDFVCEQFQDTYFGKKIIFSHVPIKDYGFDLNIHGHFHIGDREECVKEYADILSNKHKLVSLEELNYKPISLETLLK